MMSDISSDYWAASYINDLVERGIINGYPLNDDTFEFRPENEITRAEMIKLIIAALELPLEENFDGTAFADWGTVEDWAKPYIGAAVKAGIVMGSLEGDELFVNANNNISRQEMITMAVRALQIAESADSYPRENILDFDDVADWARDVVAFALKNDMINSDGGLVRPLDNAKRSESAMMLYKMLEYKRTR